MSAPGKEMGQENSGEALRRREAKTTHRLFFAVELPEGVRGEASRYIGRLREAVPEIKASWEREEKLHLTLKFLGDVEEERISGLAGAMGRAAALTDAFGLALRGTGAFPPRGLPRVLWLGVVDPSDGLTRLHHQLEEECARAGFAREQKRFHPHLTIARLRHAEGARRLAARHQEMEFETVAFRVSEIVLMRSELLPQGSRYTPLEKIGLRAKSDE
jgi:RNA 2',3'-cyclic 3'-phosphodiesterase